MERNSVSPKKGGEKQIQPDSVSHVQDIHFINPLSPTRVLIKLRIRRRDASRGRARAQCFIQVAESNRLLPMAFSMADSMYDYYAIEAEAGRSGLHYYFYVQDGKSAFWFTKYGAFVERPASGYFVYRASPSEIFQVPSWVPDAIFYQIFPDRFFNGDRRSDPPGAAPWGAPPQAASFFGGDLKGIVRKIPYLKELGVTALYLTPIFEAPSNHKYDTTDFFKVDPHFGDKDGLRDLVGQLHRDGMRVILDGVFNHTGDRFWAFQDVRRKGPDSRYADWYYVHSFPLQLDPPNYECWWGHPGMPRLNTDNPEVRRYLLDVATYWIREADIDGWRLDAADEIPHEFWRQLRQAVKSVKKDAYVVGELWFNAAPWLGGDQFDAVTNYRFRQLVIDFLIERKIRVDRFDARLQELLLDYPEQVHGAQLNLLGSHDTARILTLCGGDERKLALAVTLQMTFPGIPSVYYGDEVGLEGGRDPDCRRCFPWSKREQNEPIYRLHQKLIRIRRTHTALRHGAFRPMLVDTKRNVYAYAREDAHATIGVVINNGPRAVGVELPLQGRKIRSALDLVAGQRSPVEGDIVITELEPFSAAVLRLK